MPQLLLPLYTHIDNVCIEECDGIQVYDIHASVEIVSRTVLMAGWVCSFCIWSDLLCEVGGMSLSAAVI